MRGRKRAAIALAGALLLVAAAFALFHLRYSHAAAWRLAPRDRPWVERTLAAAESLSGRSRDELMRTRRPRLWHRPGRTCVSLVTHRRNGDGSYHACFDARDGRLVEQRDDLCTFGLTPLTDRLWKMVW